MLSKCSGLTSLSSYAIALLTACDFLTVSAFRDSIYCVFHERRTQQAADMSEASKPIRDIAYESLKHDIITGEIPAGTRIVETVYANKLHISRTPLREAFRKLELDGLVSCEARRGVIVRAFTIEDIEEIFTIRNALMGLIASSIVANVSDQAIHELDELLQQMDQSQQNEDAEALAVQNRQFHRLIEQLSDKKRILRVIDSQEEYIIRFAALSIASVVRRSNAQKEHHQMVDYLRSRDEKRFAELMCHHLEESKEVCLSAVDGRLKTAAAPKSLNREKNQKAGQRK